MFTGAFSGFIAHVKEAATLYFWFGVGLLGVAAWAGVYYGFRFLRRSRIIEDTPTSKIRSAAQGYVELHGYAALMEGPAIVAPLTGVPCTWFLYKVEEKHAPYADKARREWRSIEQGCSEHLFLLVDDTGKCVIDPENAEITPAEKSVWYGSSRRPAVGPAGARVGRLPLFRRYRYTEELLRPGDPLYAIGLFKTVRGTQNEANPSEEIGTLLREWKRDQPQLLARFDRNKDGKIDLQEWETARETARREVLKTRAKRVAEPGIHLLTHPGDRWWPYLVSALPQANLATRYRLFAAASLAFFLLSGGFAAWLVSVRMG